MSTTESMREIPIEICIPFNIVEGITGQDGNKWYIMFISRENQKIDWFINLN